MKKLLFIVMMFPLASAWAQDGNYPEKRNFRIPLIGEKAPSFKGESTNGMINFPSDFGHSWKILFSHPQDFTPVCTTEIMELARMQSKFDAAGVKLIVVSTDSMATHRQWKKSMESVWVNDREPAKINFPLVADKDLTISKKYGMIHPATNSTEAVRGVFIIDPDNIIQAFYFYPMHVGRSTDELLRFVTALQTTRDIPKVATPVNWEPGNDLLVTVNPRNNPEKPDVLPPGYYSPVWYLIFKKSNQ
jgi:peroxiredoxin (alkyl hydroperoxide reductase subunit C)